MPSSCEGTDAQLRRHTNSNDYLSLLNAADSRLAHYRSMLILFPLSTIIITGIIDKYLHIELKFSLLCIIFKIQVKPNRLNNLIKVPHCSAVVLFMCV